MRFERALLPLACLAVPLFGCVEDDGPSFYIGGNLTAEEMEGECHYETDNDLLLRGAMNVELGSSYHVFPLYSNQLVNRSSTAPLMADPNGVMVTEAEVEIRNAGNEPIAMGGLPNPFTIPVSTFVPSGADSGELGQAPGTIRAIPAAYVDFIYDNLLGGDGGDPGAQAVVIVAIKVFGETTGDVDVESDEWLWPIDVCRGSCLTACAPTDAASGDTPINCTPFQDGVTYVDCS